jgi:hypothetical protein
MSIKKGASVLSAKPNSEALFVLSKKYDGA